MLSYAWRGGETEAGAGSRSRGVPSGGAGGALVASGGLASRHRGGAELGGAGESRRDIQQQQHQQQQQQQLVRTSGSGLRQLASSFVPLVLDEGAVVSLPSPPRPPPMTAAPTGSPDSGNNNSATRRCAPADLTADFVVGFSSKNTPSAAAGFPLPTEASSATGTGQGEEVAGALRYVVLACQEDVNRAVGEALVGPDVAPPPGWHETTAVGEGGGGVLGGVEEQVNGGWKALGDVRREGAREIVDSRFGHQVVAVLSLDLLNYCRSELGITPLHRWCLRSCWRIVRTYWFGINTKE